MSIDGKELGRELSRLLTEQPASDCLSDEEMALLVEGRADTGERDRMLGHLSVCAACREIHAAAADLHRGEKPRRLPLRRPLALAASAALVAVFLVLVIKTDEPAPPGPALALSQPEHTPKAKRAAGAAGEVEETESPTAPEILAARDVEREAADAVTVDPGKAVSPPPQPAGEASRRRRGKKGPGPARTAEQALQTRPQEAPAEVEPGAAPEDRAAGPSKSFHREESTIARDKPAAGVGIHDKKDRCTRRITERYPEGDKKTEETLRIEKGGERVTEIREFDVHGRPVRIVDPLRRTEVRIEYFPDGTMKRKRSFRDGRPHGLWQVWDETGKLVEEIRYDQGRRTESRGDGKDH